MIAPRLEDLVIWQLADEIRRRVHEISATPDIARDFKFRDQLRDAASSIPRNIAEGFGRYRHGEFAQFLFIARGSLFELRDILRDGRSRRLLNEKSVKEIDWLCVRTRIGMTRLIRYLKTTPDRNEW
jgi:four helix bundle protein